MNDTYDIFKPGDEPIFSLRRGHPDIDRSYRQLYRYARHGVQSGERVVKLRVCYTPHVLGTTLGEWRRFLRARNAAAQATKKSARVGAAAGLKDARRV